MTRQINRALCGLAILLMTGIAVPGMAQIEQHAHEANGELALQLDDGKRWGTDESLRTGMAQIRKAFERKLPGFRARSLADEDYEELAETVDTQLNFMFNNCDLPPAADAQLHRLLAYIVNAAAALRGEATREAGMASLHRALGAYGKHFDDPGWPVDSGSRPG